MDMPTIVVKPGEGRSVSLGGMGVVFKVSGADTGGAFAVVEHPVNGPRNLPGLGRAKFPSLAGLVISRWRDRRLHAGWAAAALGLRRQWLRLDQSL